MCASSWFIYKDQTVHIHCGLAFISLGIVVLINIYRSCSNALSEIFSVELFVGILIFWDMLSSHWVIISYLFKAEYCPIIKDQNVQ